LHIYLFGDIKQLPAVKDSPLYSNKQKSPLAKQGKHTFNSMQRAFILNTCHRQHDHQFLDILDHISDGTVTREDYDLLSVRFSHNLEETEKYSFKDAIRLYATKVEVDEFNLEKLSNLIDLDTNQLNPVARIPARHNCLAAKNASADEADGLESVLYLAKGCKIMLHQNLWTSKGLINGAFGRVVNILYEKDKEPPNDAPRIILCEFDDYTGSSLIPGSKIVPIKAELVTFQNINNVTCSRYQFPLCLAYACSVHKSQGMTLDKVYLSNMSAIKCFYFR